MELRRQLTKARRKLAEDLSAQEEVKALLAKADERRINEPQDARKWNKVLESLEKSLDLTKARCLHDEIKIRQTEQACAALEESLAENPEAQAPILALPAPTQVSPPRQIDDLDEEWPDSLEKASALNLEEACQLQSQIDAGEIQDEALEAGLALANQVREDAPAGDHVPEPRRQLVLRAAIDKVSKRAFDDVTLEEIKLLMACHSLLTSRLEPTMRDQRLRRILDGSIKILQKKKDQMTNPKPAP